MDWLFFLLTKRIEIHQSQITNHDLLNPLKLTCVSYEVRQDDWRLTFLTRGSKCTNHRKTILIACFVRGHLNFSLCLCPFSCPYFVIGLFCYVEWIIQWGTIWISFDPKFFKAAGRSSLDKIRGTCRCTVKVCYRTLNLQMHTLFAVGPHKKMTMSVFGMGWSANSKKNKRNFRDIQWHQILIDEMTESEYQEGTCKMVKIRRVWRGMCIKFESRKICVACNQCDNSDLDIHNAEDKKLPVHINVFRWRTRRLSTIETKRESLFFFLTTVSNSCNNSSYAINFV